MEILSVLLQVDTKGATILAGFGDGVVRSFILSKKEETGKKGASDSELLLAQVRQWLVLKELT